MENNKVVSNNIKAMGQNMQLQVHEQYAINNNNTLQTLVTLMGSLLLVFGGLGYVFINSSREFSNNWEFVKQQNVFYYDAVLVAGEVSLMILWIIHKLCITIGLKERKELLMINKIRRINNYATEFKPWYKDEDEWKSFSLPDIYNAMTNVIHVAELFIFLLILIRGISIPLCKCKIATPCCIVVQAVIFLCVCCFVYYNQKWSIKIAENNFLKAVNKFRQAKELLKN